MRLKILPTFEKDAKKLPVNILVQLDKILDAIINAQTLTEIPNVKKLSGYRNAYRLRIGEYRIGFLLEDQVIILARFLQRKDIYKRFP